jgi:hypothetical protein
LASAEQTLHDFVLDLLSNDTARSAFGADPAAALAGAGLHDVTPQDVQEVVPLVLDYAPAGLALPDTGAADSVIQQLQAVAHAADIQGLPNFEASSPGTFGGGFGGETPLGDYTVGLDASTAGVSAVAGLTGGTVGAEGGLAAGLDGFAAGGSSASPLGDYAIDTSGVPLALPIPALPDLSALPTTPRFDSIGDPTAALDTDASAGTVASYVSAGGDVLAGHASTTSATLGSYLTGTGVPVGETVSDLGYDAAAHTDYATNDISGHLGSLPVPAALPDAGALPGLPGLPGLPELPAVPALPGVPDLHDLPVHLPQLPVDLPHLPVELPHLPVANPLPALGDSNVTGALGDAASHSPLGEVASPDHLALPHLVDAPTDLLLGH